jgi:class 3 adenylate cyclase/tetratricopeptide (TPR) repeat protein
MRCPSCGADLLEGAKFCSECGADLRSARGPEAERKIITGLFCDVVGSTNLGERLDPEELDTLLDRYFALSRRRIEEAGGIVEKFIGDAVVGLFGVSVSHEDDPSRAVAAAAEIVDDVRSSGLDIQVRIGVNTGEALVRPALDPASGGAVATGDCLNVAARLQSIAPPMGVIVGERTRSAVASFEFERLEAVRVKGKSEAVLAWRLAGRVSGPVEARDVGPFVGREKELESLRGAVARLAGGQGGMVLIEGEPGIGKSRLVRELRRRSPDLRWIVGRSVETRDAAGYRPFAEQIRAWVGTQPATWSALSKAAEEAGLASENLPFLAVIADVEVPAPAADRLQTLDAEALRPQIYRATRAWLDAVSRAAPLVLQFEDWHWADGASANLLRHILPLVDRHPLLVLVLTRSARSSQTAGLRTGMDVGILERVSTVALRRLAEEDAEALFAAVAGGGPADSRRGAARERAEGNPYFLMELGRFLAEQDDVGVALPDSIRAAVTSRVDRLDPDLRAPLRSASVIGRTFTRRLLADLDSTLDGALERLTATGLIERADAGGTYRFAHALTRDAVYEGVPMSERRHLHGRIAATIRGPDGEVAPEHLPMLAYHLAKAEQWNEAVEALTAAGDEAARIASDEDALAMYREAIQAHDRLPEGHWSPLERSRIDRRVAEALERLGRHGEAKRQIESALARLGVRIPTDRGAVRRAAGLRLVRRLVRPPPLPRPSATPDPTEIEIDRELELLGWMSYFRDVDDYALATLMLTSRAVRARDFEGVAVGTIRCAYVFNAVRLEKLTDRYVDRTLEAAARMDDPVAIARLLEQVGVIAFLTRGSVEASLALRRAVDAGDRAGDLRAWVAATMILGWTEMNRGHLDEARALADQVSEAGAEAGERQVEGWGVALAGYVALHDGEIEDALRLSSEGREMLRSVPDALASITVTGGISREHLRLGDVDAAKAELRAGREQASSTGIRGFVLGFAVVSLDEAEAELAVLALASKRTRENVKVAGSVMRRSHRQDRVCRWHGVNTEAMDGCRWWLLGRKERARRAFARFEALVDELECHGIGDEARRWVLHCCEVAGVEPPNPTVIARPAEPPSTLSFGDAIGGSGPQARLG